VPAPLFINAASAAGAKARTSAEVRGACMLY
jgi:hypothetical protein